MRALGPLAAAGLHEDGGSATPDRVTQRSSFLHAPEPGVNAGGDWTLIICLAASPTHGVRGLEFSAHPMPFRVSQEVHVVERRHDWHSLCRARR